MAKSGHTNAYRIQVLTTCRRGGTSYLVKAGHLYEKKKASSWWQSIDTVNVGVFIEKKCQHEGLEQEQHFRMGCGDMKMD